MALSKQQRRVCVCRHLYTLWLTVHQEALWHVTLLLQRPSADTHWCYLCNSAVLVPIALWEGSACFSIIFISFIHSLHVHQHYVCVCQYTVSICFVAVYIFSTHIHAYIHIHVHMLWLWQKLQNYIYIAKMKCGFLVNWHIYTWDTCKETFPFIVSPSAKTLQMRVKTHCFIPRCSSLSTPRMARSAITRGNLPDASLVTTSAPTWLCNSVEKEGSLYLPTRYLSSER